MAKKSAAKEEPPKKRKSTTPAPKAEAAEEGVPTPGLGTVSIPVQASVSVTNIANFDELVIEWGCLGLSEEPDSIAETSGNGRLLDPKRPPKTDDEGLHVYFAPPLPGGAYGFQFLFTYNEAALARTAKVEEEAEAA